MNPAITNKQTIADMTFTLADGAEGVFFFDNYKDIVSGAAEDHHLAAPHFINENVSFSADEEGITTTTNWGLEVTQEYPVEVIIDSYTGAVVNIFAA